MSDNIQFVPVSSANKNEIFPIPSLELGLSNAVDRWGQNPGYSMNDSGGNNGGGTNPVGGTITGVDFTIAELNGDGNEVGVTPTSTGGTLYSVDFGDCPRDILTWITERASGEKKAQLSELLEKDNYKIVYLTYDWGNNEKKE